MNVYFNNNGITTPIGDANFPIDPNTHRTTGILIQIQTASEVSYKLSRTGYATSGTAKPVSGIATINNPFSEKLEYTLILNNIETYKFTINKVVATPPPPTPVPTSLCIKGIMGSTQWNGAGAMYQDLKCNGAVRLWYGTGREYDNTISDSEIRYLKDQQSKYGTQYIILFTPPETKPGQSAQGRKPKIGEVAALYKRNLAKFRQYGVKVLMWEIFNEPDMTGRYWYGTLQDYMVALKEAYGYLHSQGEKVLGGATVRESNFYAICDLGYLSYCDYPGHHPYDGNAKGQNTRIDNIIAKHPEVKGKLVFSEWNLHFGKVPTDPKSFDASYCQNLKDAYNHQKNLVHAICYFEYKVYNSDGGHAGLLNTDYSKHQPFYDNYKSL
jgi:hypothetical protein